MSKRAVVLPEPGAKLPPLKLNESAEPPPLRSPSGTPPRNGSNFNAKALVEFHTTFASPNTWMAPLPTLAPPTTNVPVPWALPVPPSNSRSIPGANSSIPFGNSSWPTLRMVFWPLTCKFRITDIPAPTISPGMPGPSFGDSMIVSWPRSFASSTRSPSAKTRVRPAALPSAVFE